MTLRILVNTTDREECRMAIDHIFTVHPGLAEEIRSSEEFTSTRTVESDVAAVDPKIGVELDSTGTPWLEDVHASTKSKTNDGRWTKKRGVDDGVREQAEAVARAELAGTPEPATPDEGPTTALPPGAAEEPAIALAVPVSMQDVVDLYTQLSGEGLIDEGIALSLYDQCGTNFADMETNETGRAAFYTAMEALRAPAPALPGAVKLPGA